MKHLLSFFVLLLFLAGCHSEPQEVFAPHIYYQTSAQQLEEIFAISDSVEWSVLELDTAATRTNIFRLQAQVDDALNYWQTTSCPDSAKQFCNVCVDWAVFYETATDRYRFAHQLIRTDSLTEGRKLEIKNIFSEIFTADQKYKNFFVGAQRDYCQRYSIVLE